MLLYFSINGKKPERAFSQREQRKKKKRKICPTRNQTNLRALTRTIVEQIHISTPTTTNARSIIYLYARSDRFNAQTVKPLSRKYFSIGGIHRNNPRSPRENIRYGGWRLRSSLISSPSNHEFDRWPIIDYYQLRGTEFEESAIRLKPTSRNRIASSAHTYTYRYTRTHTHTHTHRDTYTYRFKLLSLSLSLVDEILREIKQK